MSKKKIELLYIDPLSLFKISVPVLLSIFATIGFIVGIQMRDIVGFFFSLLGFIVSSVMLSGVLALSAVIYNFLASKLGGYSFIYSSKDIEE